MQTREPAQDATRLGSADPLDDPAAVRRLDPHGLLQRIEGLPEQCEEAWRRSASLRLPEGAQDASELVVLGMGGSAIAGDILRSLAAARGRKPVVVARGYDAPAFVSSGTLAVACSHSGNTEETLSAFEQALERGAKGVAVTTGGRVADVAASNGATVHRYQFEGEPRSALGHQLMALLAAAERSGVLDAAGDAVEEAVAAMRALRERIGSASTAENNPAKQIARRLQGRLPVAVGAGPLAEAAHRWKTQLNENSEVWALWEELPELDHNAVVGFGRPAEIAANMHVVLLWHPALHERVRRRYDVTEAELDAAGVSYERVEVPGGHPLAQTLCAVHLGDLVSYYLALLNGVEPSPVVALDRIKSKLSGS